MPPKKAKTYRRFSGMFFCNGSAPRMFLKFNRLRDHNLRKNEKLQNKVTFSSPKTSVLLPNRPKKRLFFLSVRFLSAAPGRLVA